MVPIYRRIAMKIMTDTHPAWKSAPYPNILVTQTSENPVMYHIEGTSIKTMKHVIVLGRLVPVGEKLPNPVKPAHNGDSGRVALCKSNPPNKSTKRYKLFERDGWKCLRCGSEYDLTVDHIVSRKAGGNSSFKNLQTLCCRCNVVKADRCISYR